MVQPMDQIKSITNYKNFILDGFSEKWYEEWTHYRKRSEYEKGLKNGTFITWFVQMKLSQEGRAYLC